MTAALRVDEHVPGLHVSVDDPRVVEPPQHAGEVERQEERGLHELADRALLSHDELQSQIRHPFEEFVQRYRARFDAHETFKSTS